jgi:hypothetical protein
MKNGCCKDCMKSFSKSGKSCICQVPKAQRRTSLSSNGCKFCGCHGCNPVDIIKQKRKEMKTKLMNEGLYRDSKIRQRLLDSDDEDQELKNFGIVSLGPQNDKFDQWNKAKQQFSDFIQSIAHLNPMIMGLGCPIRHQAYIFGRPSESVNFSNRSK